MWRGPYDYLLETKENEVEQATKAKRQFFNSDEFESMFSYNSKYNTETKSQFERINSIYKSSDDFIKRNAEEHTEFVKFVQKRLSEINKIKTEMNGELKDKEIKALERLIKIFYEKSDKAFEEYEKN